jgi:hypothetical protein
LNFDKGVKGISTPSETYGNVGTCQSTIKKYTLIKPFLQTLFSLFTLEDFPHIQNRNVTLNYLTRETVISLVKCNLDSRNHVKYLLATYLSIKKL